MLEYFHPPAAPVRALADTALRTADSGYLTRRMVDVCQDVIIREEDCGVDQGIEVPEISENGQVIEKFSERVQGRYPGARHRGRHRRGADLQGSHDDEGRARERRAGRSSRSTPRPRFRTVLTCKAHSGMCAKCYGMNLATHKPVGPARRRHHRRTVHREPGTQLTMRTFHTGGVAGGDITQASRVRTVRGPKPKDGTCEIAGRSA